MNQVSLDGINSPIARIARPYPLLGQRKNGENARAKLVDLFYALVLRLYRIRSHGFILRLVSSSLYARMICPCRIITLIQINLFTLIVKLFSFRLQDSKSIRIHIMYFCQSLKKMYSLKAKKILSILSVKFRKEIYTIKSAWRTMDGYKRIKPL